MSRYFTAFLAYPVFLFVNGLAALELSSRLVHSSFEDYIRGLAWISIVVGAAIIVWHLWLESKRKSVDPQVQARRSLFLVFFFVPWEVVFLWLLIESSRLSYFGSSDLHWGVLVQMFATGIIWTTWECRLFARSWPDFK
jgi:hypothetical protein